MRRSRTRLAGSVAVALAVLLILLNIPVNVISGSLPRSVVSHKLIWAIALAAGLTAAAAMTWWLSRRSPDEEHQSPSQVPDPAVVVGEIPREPPAFVDRAMVGRLAAAAASGTITIVCTVTGLRGVGKTQVAAAYARSRIRDRWGLVGWVNAESRDVLLAGMARVAEAVGVADPGGDSAESARRLRDHLQSWPGPGLLVFDNAADPDLLRPFLPAAGDTQLIVTSTDQAFAEWGVPVDVSVFTRLESVGYLAERTGLDDQNGADAARALQTRDLSADQAAGSPAPSR